MRRSNLTIFSALLVFFAFAQDPATLKSYETTWAETPPLIDGLLDDDVWQSVDWGGDFIQRMPEDGAEPTQPTKFKILYDAKYLYVGIFAMDSEPEKIVRRMSRRDGFEGDMVEINIDSYADKRTAFSFTASASGVKGEEYISNNGDDWDSTWDPIWYLKTSLNKDGWIAEFKIPLSQLRFADQPQHVWGIQVMRHLFREQERSFWQPIAQDAPGWVHLFGELRGIKGIRPQKQLEIQPYVLASMERSPSVDGDPYRDGKDQSIDGGLDAKIGITSDITLDLTINPDFGQVEADPSQVNLSAFQLFFRERRPFFLEGNNILDFRLTQSWAGVPFNNDNLFYSRRIGSRPSYYPNDGDISHVDKIKNTRILGAAKLTGKNSKGFSWGILESLTNRETVEVMDTLGGKRDIAVEPMTNYVVGRVQQDINEGNAILGAMFTATNRFLNDDQFNFLHKSAYSGGIDFTQNFLDRNYYVSMNAIFSNVNGSTEALERTQRSPQRFYQRPDNMHKDVDTTMTSMSGSSASLSLGKRNGNLIFQTGATMRTPGVELDDVGFLRQSDYVSQWTWAQYRILKPFGIFRWYRLNMNQYLTWDFDGVNLYKAVNTNMHAQFNNFWFVGMGSTLEGQSVSNADLRGGPSIRYPGRRNLWMYFGTNDQKMIQLEVNPWISRGFEDYSNSKGIWTSLRIQPTDALRISFSPSIDWNQDKLQYVDRYTGPNGDEFILGHIKQTTYRASLRLNYIITPNLSVEYWGQPFISSGEYTEFKRVLDPSSERYEKRYRLYNDEEISFSSENESYLIDDNRDGNTDYELYNPNFNVMQFRSNFVVRWEYVPGSTLFVVWTSNASGFHNAPENRFSDLSNDLQNIDATNIFLIKYTYRFLL